MTWTARVVAAVCWLLPGLLLPPGSAAGQDSDALENATARNRPGLARPVEQEWEIGMEVQAGAGAVVGIEATMPVPRDWPEQRVEVVRETRSDNVRGLKYRELDGSVRQVVVTIPRLAAGERAQVVLRIKVTKHMVTAPEVTSQLKVPGSLNRELRPYLLPSPYIEVRDERIRAAAEEAVAGKETDWQRVEAIFDWVREHVRYQFDVKIKGATQALEDGYGDCEELTSLFVAMCRAQGIPARAVWIPDHCYPEFYLEDSNGQGSWYPCQAAGAREFGAMTEPKPVLQKGDNFKVPGQREPQRYVAETLRARHAEANPQVQFFRRPVSD